VKQKKLCLYTGSRLVAFRFAIYFKINFLTFLTFMADAVDVTELAD